MAYSKELEAVIDAALADGVITEKERAVLHKKALLEGVDPDELDVVIEGRLAKMKREVDWLRPTPPATEKRGNIVKCPNCGATIEAGAVSCKECGYVFTNVAANRSSEKLSKLIEEKVSIYRGIITRAGDDEKKNLSEQRDKEVCTIIEHFPIPTAKEDLMEFIASMDGKQRAASESCLWDAYASKYKESVNKAKVLFPNDAQMSQLIRTTSKFSFKKYFTRETIITFLIIMGLSLPFLIGFLCLGVSSCQDNRERERVELKLQQVISSIDALPTPTVENYDECVVALKRINYKDDSFGYSQEEIVKDKLNNYIDLLQMIQPRYLDKKTGKPTTNSTNGNTENPQNPKYIQHVSKY